MRLYTCLHVCVFVYVRVSVCMRARDGEGEGEEGVPGACTVSMMAVTSVSRQDRESYSRVLRYSVLSSHGSLGGTRSKDLV